MAPATCNTEPLRTIVIGAMAADTIGAVDSVRPDPAATNLKVASLHQAFGGCAANIAYNLQLLGQHPLVIAASGDRDDHDLLNYLADLHLPGEGILRQQNQSSSRAFIFTFADGQQTTYFYPGCEPTQARWQQHLQQFRQPAQTIIQAPLAPPLMLTGLAWAAQTGAPLVAWCPGQYVEQLSAGDINAGLQHSHLLIANAHEMQVLNRQTRNIPAAVTIITTRGEAAVAVQTGEHIEQVQVPPLTSVDPTGCGDAFTAALVHHLAQHGHAPYSVSALREAVAAGIALAGRCLLQTGAQQHKLA